MENVHPLKAYREKQEPPLSQEDLAILLGVTRVTVTRWESGARKMNDEIVPKVSRATGIPAAELRPDLASMLSPISDQGVSI